jgi:hypothetical protein
MYHPPINHLIKQFDLARFLIPPKETNIGLTLKLASFSFVHLSMIDNLVQVVHNREHGFSKRSNPAGVHNFTHT